MHIYIYTYIYIYIYLLLFQTEKGQRKPKRFSLVRLPFADEETSWSYPFGSGLNGLNGLGHMWLSNMFPEKKAVMEYVSCFQIWSHCTKAASNVISEYGAGLKQAPRAWKLFPSMISEYKHGCLEVASTHVPSTRSLFFQSQRSYQPAEGRVGAKRRQRPRPLPAITNRLLAEPGGGPWVNCAWDEVSRGLFVGGHIIKAPKHGRVISCIRHDFRVRNWFQSWSQNIEAVFKYDFSVQKLLWNIISEYKAGFKHDPRVWVSKLFSSMFSEKRTSLRTGLC